MTGVTDPYTLEVWRDAGELRDGTFAYWNDPAVEADKVWNVEGAGGFPGMERYLEEAGLAGLLEASLRRLGERGRRLEGRGADLACGTCWAAPRLLTPDVERLFCVEYLHAAAAASGAARAGALCGAGRSRGALSGQLL